MQDNIDTVLALAQEYDITSMKKTAEDWLVNAYVGGHICKSTGGSTRQQAQEWLHFLQLARTYKLNAFAMAIRGRLNALNYECMRTMLDTELMEAIEG